MKFHVITLLSAIASLLIVHNSAENVPVENPNAHGLHNDNALSSAPPISSTSSPSLDQHLNFVQAFIKTFFIIIISEIGDKTFFIAAIMAMKHPRMMVFIGAISALALMTIISVLCGWAFSIIPKIYTYYGSVALFLIFGVKMIYDGLRMSPNEAQEEYDEVQQELRKRDDERAKRLKKRSKREAVSPTADEATVQVLPDVTEITEVTIETAHSMNGVRSEDDKQRKSPQFEKDVEVGYVSKDSKKKIFRMLSHILLQAFTLTFLAEWGDRSQISTMALAIKDDKLGITAGGIIGHSICTGLAVIGGRIIAQKISVKTVTIVGGFIFILFALLTLLFESSDSPSPTQ